MAGLGAGRLPIGGGVAFACYSKRGHVSYGLSVKKMAIDRVSV